MRSADESPGPTDDETLQEAEEQLAELDRALAEGTPDQPKPGSDMPPEAKRHRAMGIGLTVSGVAVLGAGIGMLVWGTGYGAKAQAQVDDFTPTPSVLDQGEDFIASERRKGAAWMAGGAVVATLGVVGVAIGIQQLLEAKRANRPSVSAGFSPRGMALVVQGRF